MYRITDDLKTFLESPVAVLVGTGDDRGRPHAAYGWGPRVEEDQRTVEVFLDTERAEQTLANLRANGKIAMTVADPVSYRSVQLKGTFRDAGEVDDEDRAWVQRKREDFLVVTSLVGDPTRVIRNMWLEDIVRVRFTAERAFNQTPGPEAGKPL